MASNYLLEPPSFVSDTKKFSQYEKDLRLWSRLTTVKKDLQAELVVYRLDGHKSGIKEKIMMQIGSELEGNEDGINKLITLQKGIYEFRNRIRKTGESVQMFITEWENLYHKAKNSVYCQTWFYVLNYYRQQSWTQCQRSWL